jgi:tRNA G18 (ribose-2'-O)-methylase SpoU
MHDDLEQNDRRNVTNEFRGLPVDEIKQILNTRRHRLEIAIENVERDFNAGTVVRNANAFNASAVHIIGRRQWNKRGAMATDHYMNIHYHPDIESFIAATRGKHIIGIDNIAGSVPLHEHPLPEDAVLVFGSEGPGLSSDMVARCEKIIAIEQFGSTRSVNVGVASGIAMYTWIQQHVLGKL